MKKIITLAVLGLAVTACDPFNDEPGGTPAIKYVTVTGASYGPIEAAEASSVWAVDAQTSTATSGRMVVVTTNQLLDGTSIEAEPYELNGATGCVPTGASNADNSNGWLTVTTTAGTAPTGGKWYTCYYPSAATSDDGGSVVLYYSAVAPGIATAARPTVAGVGPAADLQYRGTIKAKNGQDLAIAVNASYGSVSITPAPAAGATRLNVATGSTTALGQVVANRDTAATAWTIASAVDSNGDTVEGAARGTLSAATGTTVNYVAPATLPAGTTYVQIVARATNRNVIANRTIRVAAP